MSLKGNAGLKWVPPGGTETTHPLQHPLRLEAAPSLRRRRVSVQPWDFSAAPTVFESSASAEEFRCRHRFEDFPRRLLRLLDHAAGGVQVDYYPDLDRSTFFPLLLVDASEEQSLDPDADRFGYGEYERELRLRSADGTPLWPLYVPVGFTGAGEENLPRDAAMDTDSDGDGVVDGFNTLEDFDGGTATFSLDGGRGAQQIDLTRGNSDLVGWLSQWVLRVFPGDEVTVSVEAETQDGTGVATARLQFLFKDEDGNTQAPHAVDHQGGMTRIEISKVAPANTATVQLRLRGEVAGSSGDTGTVWFRDARLLRASSDPATYANPHVDGGSQTGDTLDTAGWPANETNVVREGDVLRAGGSGETQAAADDVTHFFRAAADVDSDSNGDATIPLTVEIGSGNTPADGAALRLTHPMF